MGGGWTGGLEGGAYPDTGRGEGRGRWEPRVAMPLAIICVVACNSIVVTSTWVGQLVHLKMMHGLK